MTTKTTITQFTLHRESESPVFGEDNIDVRLQDEGGGYFLELKQVNSNGEAQIRIDFEELELILNKARELWETKQ